MAHNTGGAFFEKLTKVLPGGMAFEFLEGSWPVPEIFKIIQKRGHIEEQEMYRTFNMGVGYICIVSSPEFDKVAKALKKKKYPFYLIGQIIGRQAKKVYFVKES